MIDTARPSNPNEQEWTAGRRVAADETGIRRDGTMTSATKALSLVLKNDSYELVRFSEVIDEFADRNQFPEQDRFELQLCLEEAVMNVVNYGFDDIEEHDIHVDLQLKDDDRTLVVRIVDDGKELDPFGDIASPDLDSFLQDQAMGGLGFHLMRKYTDDISYRRQDGRNHLTLTKTITDE